ncbi:hypothetical protein D3C80_1418710 [compost metagenome]
MPGQRREGATDADATRSMTHHAFGNLPVPGTSQCQGLPRVFRHGIARGQGSFRRWHGRQCAGNGLDLIIGQGFGQRLHHRAAPRTTAKIIQLLAQVLRGQPCQSRKAGRRHPHAIRAMAGKTGGCPRLCAALGENFLTIGSHGTAGRHEHQAAQHHPVE